ncbi:alpha/beta hydrolase [Methylocystis heyeri]|uniref:Alpha/beta fold hydrolase n=1 Tax=Methylocystis heyeri TaxID=391905 RepID=A0A6B8KJA8_9HYPH|nr:alpha/beta fold hydrolase [Methylocystis heyeri]QGM47609.1 alpha/beta fold hydrolase [Methylocystis heyeri]
MKLIKGAATTALLLYLSALLGLALFQRSLIYNPGSAIVSPAQAGLALTQTLRLSSKDGQELIAWFEPPRDGRPLILYFHGKGGILADRQERFRLLTGSGYGLLALSYRGYGGSTGAPTEEGLLLDAEAAYAEAVRRGFAGPRLVIMGESLGTGVATIMASRHEAAALVLDAPFLSALDVAEGRYPIFPVNIVMKDQFRSDLAIGSVHMPVLMMHGEADTVIPIDSARRLFALAREPKEFIDAPEGKHLVLLQPGVYPRFAAFIDAATKR